MVALIGIALNEQRETCIYLYRTIKHHFKLLELLILHRGIIIGKLEERDVVTC